MAAGSQISVAEHLNTSYRPDCDYVDGCIMERNLGEYEHSRPQGRLIIFFGIREKEWRIRVVPEQRVQVNEQHFRSADVCVVEKGAPIEAIFRNPPLLCIEILSRDDSFKSIVERLDYYISMGVPNVWVLDPSTRRGYTYSAGFIEATDGVLRITGSSIAVPLTNILE